MNRTTIQEQLSALADGHLQGEELTQVVGALRTRDDLQVAWRDWHLVGDVLRTGAHSPCSETSRFVERLRERLADEPAPLRAMAPVVVHALPTVRAEAANAPVFRWKLVAGAASLAAAAAIGWNWVGSPAVAPRAELALQQAQPAAVAAAGSVLAVAGPTRVVVGNGAPQVMLRDARLDELLAAHQQAGGASQMPSGFLRNATFEEGPSR